MYFSKPLRVMLAYLCLPLLSWAQSPPVDWDHTFGTSMEEEAGDLIRCPDGGFLLMGFSEGSNEFEKSDTTIGGSDIWLVKTNAFGYQVWDKTIHTNGGEYLPTNASGHLVVSTPDGGYLVLATSAGSTPGWDLTSPTYGQSDLLLFKVDSLGNVLWDRVFGGSGDEYAEGIYSSPDGNFVLLSTSTSGISGNKTEATQGLYDYWVVKVDPAGNILWQNDLGGIQSDRASALVFYPNAGMAVVGYSDSPVSGDKTTDLLVGSNETWVVRLGATGNTVWDLTRTPYPTYWDVENTLDGNLTGVANQYYLHKMDTLFNPIWNLALPPNNNGFGGFGVKVLPDNSVLAMGTYLNTGHTVVNRVRPNGSVQWTGWYSGTTPGPNDYDRFRGVAVLPDTTFVVLTYSSSLTGDSKTAPFHGAHDYWLFHSCTDTGACRFIEGRVYEDTDLSCSMVTAEPGLPMSVIEVLPGPSFILSDSSGYFRVPVDTGANSYTLIHHPYPYRNPVCPNPATISVTLTALSPSYSQAFFGTDPIPSQTDLGVHLVVSPIRAGLPYSVWGTVYNEGTDTVSGTLRITPAHAATFVSAVPAPGSVSVDTVTWAVTNLPPLHSRLFRANYLAGVGWITGDTVPVQGWVSTPGDVDSTDNRHVVPRIVTGSYDPNLKEVEPQGQDSLGYIPLPVPLTYSIQFQNTGNDTAFTVVVRDTLPEWLDLGTFHTLGASHSYVVTAEDSNILVFTFGNIHLPDSTTNEPLSHGFLSFEIGFKPNVPMGTTQANSAAIYFDFNAPVWTSPALTTVDTCHFFQANMTVSGFQMETPAGLATQWFWNQNPIPGATTATFTATQSGLYFAVVEDGYGCTDTTDSQYYSVCEMTDPVVTASPDSLTVSGAATYQWFWNGNLLVGDTAQTLFPQVTGNYQVVVTYGDGCTDTSAVIPWSLLGRLGSEWGGFQIYPNPFSESFTLVWAGMTGPIRWELTDAVGKIVASGWLLEGEGMTVLEVPDLPMGVYGIRLEGTSGSLSRRLVRGN